jgi:diguanylate cyclase (GGDEF)-like protein
MFKLKNNNKLKLDYIKKMNLMMPEYDQSKTQIKKKTIRQYFYVGSIIIVILPSVLLIGFYSKSLQQEYVIKVQQLSESILAEKKRFLKNAIDRTFYMIESERELAGLEGNAKSNTQDQIETIAKTRITKAIRNLRLIDNGYIWVNQVVNYQGGDNYAIRLIHPNLPETEGSYLSTGIKDIKGSKPYEVELDGINADGEVFFDYYFKKMGSDKIVHKLSYAKHYPDFQWIIATGVYLDDIDQLIRAETERMQSTYDKQILRSIIIAILAFLTSIFVMIVFEKRIRKLIHSYEDQVYQREQTLKKSERFTKAIINSLSPHVAIIDHNGKIIDTNTAWKRFSEENGLLHDWESTGFNYLDVCDAVITERDKELANKAATGIRSVLSGDIDEFVLVYECNAPKIKRWFNMRVRRISGVIPSKAVIAHEDVTPLKYVEETLRTLSQQDGLTGLANRRFFEETLKREWPRAARDKAPLSILMLDIDFFKKLNDTYGHFEGDECIKSFASMLRSELKRPADLPVRYGGEEFIALLPNTKLDSALVLAEGICKHTYDLNIPNINSLVANRVTVSIGVACIYPTLNNSPKELLDLADKALYQAKRSGRNRACKL